MNNARAAQPSAPQASALFGAVASAYARHRITYPQAFFAAFRSHLAGADPLVQDCGCGCGQAGLDLAAQGLRVFASAAQLTAATPHPRIR
jgi:2-polyprenyl-3-methyl-5-hydroxy-6-metoxy-1,4-benzoquinol methylase